MDEMTLLTAPRESALGPYSKEFVGNAKLTMQNGPLKAVKKE